MPDKMFQVQTMVTEYRTFQAEGPDVGIIDQEIADITLLDSFEVK